MSGDVYGRKLFSQCDPEEIVRLSKVVFVEGHLDKIDDLIVAILPLANIVYYRYIRKLDDREYAKEDLISDAILRLYQDMSLRWDKYIHIEAYYEYYSSILKNGMIGQVHGYHQYYVVDDVDITELPIEDKSDDFDRIEMEMVRQSLIDNTIKVAERILKCRVVNTNLLLNILRIKYIEKSSLDSLKSRVRVLGISSNLFNFYCEHVDYVYKLSFNYQYAIIGGNDKMISRISSAIGRFEDVTYKMLSSEYYDSIIPEIYAEFGADLTKKFVKTFGGRSIQIPEYRNFCDTLLGGVVLTLSDGDKSNLYRVAEEYNVPYRTLSRIYDKAAKFDKKEGATIE